MRGVPNAGGVGAPPRLSPSGGRSPSTLPPRANIFYGWTHIPLLATVASSALVICTGVLLALEAPPRCGEWMGWVAGLQGLVSEAGGRGAGPRLWSRWSALRLNISTTALRAPRLPCVFPRVKADVKCADSLRTGANFGVAATMMTKIQKNYYLTLY